MKIVCSYNLHLEIKKKIIEKSLSDGRKASDWLNVFLTNLFDGNTLIIELDPELKKTLSDYCDKYDRNEKFLIEKMIRKFCVDTTGDEKQKEKPKKTVKRFVPPSVEDVFNYCKERCNNINAQNFVDHYTGSKWMRGTTKIKDWKACVRTWEQKNKDNNNATPEKITDVNDPDHWTQNLGI